jgi:hypothetical protein
MIDSRFLLLDPQDNVVVARLRVASGERIVLDGLAVTLDRDLPIGHKLARLAISAGEHILKYGAPIGVATTDIPAGAHVHVHNVRSDYTPTYTLDAAKEAS